MICALQIAVQTLWNIKIVVLVKAEHENRISHVGMSSVKTGIANTLGQNGERSNTSSGLVLFNVS